MVVYGSGRIFRVNKLSVTETTEDLDDVTRGTSGHGGGNPMHACDKMAHFNMLGVDTAGGKNQIVS